MFEALADAVLVAHFAFVLFVVGGLVLVVLGNRRGWAWVNASWFRALHLLAIGCVVAETWLGIECPLTTLESGLRLRGGTTPYATSFIGHWVQRLLFYDAPAWLFTLAYSAFGLVVIAVWWRYPPRRGEGERK